MDHLQLSLAERNKLHATPSAVTHVIQGIATRNHLSVAGFKKSIAALGIDYDTYRKNIRKQMLIGQLQRRVIGPKVHLTDKDVAAFINQYQHTTHSADTEYRVWDIRVPLPESPTTACVRSAKKRALMLVNQLKSGQSATSLIDSTQKTAHPVSGNDMGWRVAQALPEQFVTPVQALAVKGVAKPVRAPNGFHVLQLLGKRAKQPTPLSQKHARQLAYAHAFNQQLKQWFTALKAAAYIHQVAK